MKRFSLAAGLALAMMACQLEPDLGELVQDMVVQTEYDTLFQNQNVFKSFASFTIREDTIGFVSNIDDDTVLVDGVNAEDFVTPVVNEVIESTEAAGYTQVAENSNPDFAVKVVVFDNFSFYQTINYPSYYSGYYGYYGYYYPYVTTYTSNTATLVIEVIDLKHFVENGSKYKVVWTAYIGDLYATIDLKTKTVEGVTQAYQQSAYFNKN